MLKLKLLSSYKITIISLITPIFSLNLNAIKLHLQINLIVKYMGYYFVFTYMDISLHNKHFGPTLQ